MALLIGALSGVYAWWFSSHLPPTDHSDFAQLHAAASALLAGRDPYAEIGPGRAFGWDFPLLYPLPAVLLAVPFAPLPEHVADGCFLGAGVAVLVWALTADRALATTRLAGLGSVAFLNAAQTAQWSPILTASVLIPSLGALVAAKPTLGLATLGAQPWRAIRAPLVGAAALVLLSLAIRPTWPLEWLRTLGSAPHIRPMVLRPGGVLLLLAALRWRRPEARLLLGLAVLPQSPFPYEALPLLLIPRTVPQQAVLAGATWAGWLWWFRHAPSDYAASADLMGLTLLVTAYLPALALVLWRRAEPP